MNRLIEMLLGLPSGFLAREGDLSVRFNPVWPWQETVGAAVWNLVLAGLFAWLIVAIYRRDARTRRARLLLGALRGSLVLLLLVLLNRPVVTLTQNRVEPSVLAVMVDDSLSMKVRDVQTDPQSGDSESRPTTAASASAVARLDAAKEWLASPVMQELAKVHQIRLYRFDRAAEGLGTVTVGPNGELSLPSALTGITPNGQATTVGNAVAETVSDLAGQRLAGVVVLTDGRDAPVRDAAPTEAYARLRELGAKVYPVEIGGEKPPRNLGIQNVVMQDAAFKDDLVSVRVTLRGTGYAPGQRAVVKLVDGRTGQPLPGANGNAEGSAVIPADGPVDVEIALRPETVGDVDVQAVVSAVGTTTGEGEVDDADNTRTSRLTVLDTKVNLLYVEGYPRWDYRYLRTEMMRDKTVDVSILLTSADEGFAQEGDKPIRRFPESMEELLSYDVVIIGDVDPRQFTDRQLAMLGEFVAQKGGGLAMVAGPRYAPVAYRNTPLEALLPVNLARVTPGPGADLTTGFRMVVTPAGAASGVFRFFADPAANERYLREEMQMLFWYLRGVTVKAGAGEVLAEHPTDIGPDGKKAPILVAGRYGAGRTLFSATDDSWRLRYYTGESVFDTYWVQQIRLLARSRKLGQRLYTLSPSRSTYELGEQVSVHLRLLDNIGSGSPTGVGDRIEAEVVDENGQVIRREPLVRQEDRPDTYVGTWRADRTGRETVRVGYVSAGAGGATAAFDVIAPRLELADPRTDRSALERLAGETMGKALKLADTGQLPGLIPSAAKVTPVEASRQLWDAPIVMVLFVLLITAEWVGRKLYGMV